VTKSQFDLCRALSHGVAVAGERGSRIAASADRVSASGSSTGSRTNRSGRLSDPHDFFQCV
jgi:hypothetical protein